MSDVVRFAALDVETANADPGSICQIGMAFSLPGGAIRTFGTYVNPGQAFDAYNSSIHGITADTVAGSPLFPDAVEIIRELVETLPIFAHSGFDRSAMEAASRRYAIAPPNIHWCDSLRLARAAWPDLKSHSLASLKKALGLVFTHHDAVEDARACIEIVRRAEADTGLTFAELLAPKPKAPDPTRRALEGAAGGRLAGQIAVFTGALTLPRKEAMAMAAQAGITVAPGVTAKITLLIVGDQDLTALAGHSKSSKHRKAEELIAAGVAIRIIGETEFVQMIAEG